MSLEKKSKGIKLMVTRDEIVNKIKDSSDRNTKLVFELCSILMELPVRNNISLEYLKEVEDNLLEKIRTSYDDCCQFSWEYRKIDDLIIGDKGKILSKYLNIYWNTMLVLSFIIGNYLDNYVNHIGESKYLIDVHNHYAMLGGAMHEFFKKYQKYISNIGEELYDW